MFVFRHRCALAAAALAGLFLGSSAFAQTDNGWGQWEKIEGGSQRKWTGGYSHCQPSHSTGASAFTWECRPCEGAASGYGNYCWVGYSFEYMACDDTTKEPLGYRLETYRRKTQKRCGPEEYKNTVHDGFDRWGEVIAKEDEGRFGTPNPVTPENPPSSLKGPETADGGNVPEDEKSFHKAEKKEEPKTDTSKTDTSKSDTSKSDTSKTDTSKTDTNVKTSTDKGKVEKRPRKEVKEVRRTSTRRARIDNGQTTSTGGVSPEAATAIGTGIAVGIGLGLGGGRMGGDRMGGDRGMMRDR